MIEREAHKELEKWKASKVRKPLVLRGARQVGKTTMVNQFSKKYPHYLYLNLELLKDRKPFEQIKEVRELIRALFFLKDIPFSRREETLLFIDEIQEVPEAFNLLRYFYEFYPEIHVIAAGSLLDILLNKKGNFPVGRVSFLVIRPLSFMEFLKAQGEGESLKQFHQVPLNEFAHYKLLKKFHEYAMIGGMPEIVQTYIHQRDPLILQNIYDALLATYLDDVEKYAVSDSQAMVLRHVISTVFSEAGRRIKFAGFGNSNYRSREIGEALRILEKIFLIELIYPTTSPKIPIIPNKRRSPRLRVFDTGLVNYSLGIQKSMVGITDLHQTYQGILIEHLVGQELIAHQYRVLAKTNFWIREKKSSDAEVDYLFQYRDKLVPVEVKSGKSGKLKSLHMFMDVAPHDLAVRFYSGSVKIDHLKTASGKKFKLLNLPYFTGTLLADYLNWLDEED